MVPVYKVSISALTFSSNSGSPVQKEAYSSKCSSQKSPSLDARVGYGALSMDPKFQKIKSTCMGSTDS